MILIAAKDKPLPRAGKGTVMKKAALVQYQNEIDEMSVVFTFIPSFRFSLWTFVPDTQKLKEQRMLNLSFLRPLGM